MRTGPRWIGRREAAPMNAGTVAAIAELFASIASERSA
jgi:hypothetical protein